MDVAIIGGGAAGFFAAITAKENHPGARVVIFEKTKNLLAKVKVSGGGRCNVTNACTDIKQLSDAYPRGKTALKRAFHTFNTQHAMQWFESRGVPLMVQDDQRVFPASQSSQTIVDCFLNQTQKLGIQIETGCGVRSIRPSGDQLELFFSDNAPAQRFDKIIVASVGSPQRKGLQWLERLGHKIIDPVPSLFTFNLPNEPITQLMGLAAENALVSIQGTKLKSQGPLLITHWGMSGPAVLKLSAFGARLLSEMDYTFNIQVNWAATTNNDLVLSALNTIANQHPGKVLPKIKPYSLPERLWRFLLEKCDLPMTKKWSELSKKATNQLVNVLTNDVYSVKGKTTFKEEFVTCGGVSLASIDFNTMQSKACKNLYFAGEVLDIDGVTGGYNFQAAWTTGYIAGQLK